ncbi:glutamate decarboxylase [Synechococcus sp. RSCCF101]|uniref:glutamate decarboxylase n=1 Tax=Synechococcus sp. RSCCF101 TaxID=2511069 RepID=UPI001248867F|nr:glutamate decarboxylase [Synechococcus sp. RSCCF101]QEY31906.1 glutamate decarboxylase [Synechococcus sp. RSCCF101]
MPLHQPRSGRASGATSADQDLNLQLLVTPLPHDRFPSEGRDAKVTMQTLRAELLLDGNSKQNLATFCQTYEGDEVRELMALAVDKNLIDKDEYPQTAEIERRCVAFLADLWNAPGSPVGCSTIGSSEAAMLGGMAAKWRWRARRRARGLSTDRPNMVCGSVQICWKKFARYWDIELREVEMEPGRLCLDPERMLEQVDENTIMVVPTLGVTYHGLYEPVAELCAALDALQERTGLDVPVHVDAASGGFLAPFTAPELIWDFRLERVRSINASGHKFGLAPLGVGWVLWRDRQDLPEELVFHVSYLGGDMPTFQINFSRPAGQVIAQYYDFVRLGRQGYRLIQQACADNARHFAQRLTALGPFTLVHDGDAASGIPAVVWTLAEGAETRFSLYDLADRLRMRGWQVPAYPFTGSLAGTAYQRILVKRDFSREMADLLLEDIRQALVFFQAHPVSAPLTASEAASFSHL